MIAKLMKTLFVASAALVVVASTMARRKARERKKGPLERILATLK